MVAGSSGSPWYDPQPDLMVREIPEMSVTPTKAMVLAAGLGLRMRPLTDHMPKPLVRVAGQPLLDHVLDKLAGAGVSEAVVNVHYLPDQIIQHTASRARPRRRCREGAAPAWQGAVLPPQRRYDVDRWRAAQSGAARRSLRSRPDG